ncbi:H-NS family nucleoid-associated regulatory protein [Salipiger mucosus]|uniref:DNA-binding protein, H-NS family n=1 Tax=Salipiger mucosus DSM 16094 TaxID=1123237 RepID=S9QFE1_9RHOB|nr:H-NS histone family protein [Salipiger mucosus]EPX78328.1 DNA-binding protein, H-NS family [Salipiger mucosus DSM 16094]
MNKIDVNSLSKNELLALQKDIDKAIKDREEREKIEALAAAEAKAREMGYTLSELLAARGEGKKKSVNPPKYRHPENPEKTWTGRGRQPDWIKEALGSGKSLDDFLIAE